MLTNDASTYANVVRVLAERVDFVGRNVLGRQFECREMLLEDRQHLRRVLLGLGHVHLLQRHVRLSRSRHVRHDARDRQHAVVRVHKVGQRAREQPELGRLLCQLQLARRDKHLRDFVRHQRRHVRLVRIVRGLEEVDLVAHAAVRHRQDELFELGLLWERAASDNIVNKQRTHTKQACYVS